MEDLLVFLLAVALIWAAVLLTYRKYRLKERGFSLYPATLIWRTRRGIGLIDRVAGSHTRGWRAYGNFAAVVGVFLMFFIFVMLALNAVILFFLRPEIPLPGVMFVLPGLIPGLTLVLWLIVIGVVLAVHELFHGFLLRSQGLRTKFIGGMLFLFIPGAFVEPDEKELMRARSSKRMRMFAAGPMSNVLISVLFLGLLLALIVPKPGVYVYGLAPGYPASEPGLYIQDVENGWENLFTPGLRIWAIDNENMSTLEDFQNFLENTGPGEEVVVWVDNENFKVRLGENPENENRGYLGITPSSASLWFGMRIEAIDNETINTFDDFDRFMKNTEPGQLIEILADNRTFRIRLVADPDNENRGYLGVIAMPALPRSAYLDPRTALGGAVSVILGGAVFHPWFYDAVVPWAVIDLLKWLFALNLLVGLFNLLPAKPLDGGYIFEALLERRTTRERARKITKVLSYVVLVLILLNLIPRIRGWLG